MNDTLINKYFKEYTRNFTIRKTLFKAISFFLEATLRAKSFVPSKVGIEVKKIRPYNGIKRVQRLLKNKFFSNEFCLSAYQHFMKKLIPKDKPLVLALDWTIIKDKFCFLSISWVLQSGRSIPLYFDGYDVSSKIIWPFIENILTLFVHIVYIIWPRQIVDNI